MSDKPPPYAPPAYNGGYQNQGYAQMGQGYQPQQAGYPGGYGTGAPPGYQPLPQGMSQPSYMGTQTTVTVQPQPTTSVVVVGGCPACRVGVLEDDYTCLGICCAIAFFPIGLLCCLALRQRRCPNCGAIFG
ncbi:membrane protein BRI3-like [Branchiostoma lanceolatum]|uniref:Membrane protein BRI3 n=1 Tax=Branchiostoma lanceolatum TaxID=7740 RepID=A0A8K0AEE2_BRALA|nr:BRI3 [Branchiostoma lanceolatum]